LVPRGFAPQGLRNPRPTTVLLVRHAATDALGLRLAGRASGCPLNPHGLSQVRDLGLALASRAIDAIYTSPLERTVQTAEAIASHHDLRVQSVHGLHEIDFGEWTGCLFQDLEADRRWQLFNRQRSRSIVPGGEQPLETQRRIVRALSDLRASHPGGIVVAVTHGDVIRLALVRLLRRPLDDYAHLDIAPATISELAMSSENARVVSIGQAASSASAIPSPS
jgi:broad specificity phosphatase PhoE